MKHVKGFNNFKNDRRKQQVVEKAQNNYYYKKGKSIQKSIFEMELLKEGYSVDLVTSLNESYSLSKVDNKIIDCLYEYLKNGNTNGLDLLTEELTIAGRKLPTFSDMYNKAGELINKGIQVGKSVIKSFKDFISNIGNIIKNLFEKIKAFFIKVWEAFKPKVIAAMGTIKKALSGGVTSKMTSAVDSISSDAGQNEITNLSQDLSKTCSKFSAGDIGNMSEESAKHLEDEAGEYKDIEGDPDVEKLMQESLERRGSVGKIFYSIKGYISEGGTIDELNSAIFEAEEKKVEFKEGDEVTYKNKEGKEVTKSIIRIEGENAVFKMKDSEEEFTKPLSDLKKAEGLGKKLLTGFVGDEPEKKGVFGWLVEAVGFVFNPLAKLTEFAIKGGTNGILTVISAIARGIKNAFKFVVIGVVAGLVYHIVHGLSALAGGHGEGEGGSHGEEATEGAVEGAADAAKGEVANAAAKATSKINLAKESYEFLFESEAQTLGPVDITKPSKHTSGLWDQIKSMALPVVGGLLLSALSHFFPMVGVVLEVILVTIGIFELLGAVCKVDKIKQKMVKVCSIQHDIHHFLEAKSGGGH